MSVRPLEGEYERGRQTDDGFMAVTHHPSGNGFAVVEWRESEGKWYVPNRHGGETGSSSLIVALRLRSGGGTPRMTLTEARRAAGIEE